MGERIFRTLLLLYPASFRERFQEEMMEFFRLERDAAQIGQGGGAPRRSGKVLGFWLRTLRDLLGAAARQRLRSMAAGTRDGHLRRAGATGHPEPPGVGRAEAKVPWRDGLFQDLQFAIRALFRRPGFAMVSVGVLGLGIGASTTLFSAVHGVLLQPLPYPDPEALVFLGSKFPEGTRISGMSIPELMDVMGEVGSVEGYAAARGQALDLVGEGIPERVAVLQVSPDYFDVLGTTPEMGRFFHPDEHQMVEAGAAVISHGLWVRRWGENPDVVGSTFLASDGASFDLKVFTVVGVLPAGFVTPPPLQDPYSRLPDAEILVPLPLGPGAYGTPRTNYTVRAVARLGPGATLERLNGELETLALSLKEAHPEAHLRGETYLGLGARSLLDEVVGSRRRDLITLLGATLLLLLIACANVAGLLLARTLDRAREFGLRTALGAGRGRLVRQILTESVVLSLTGGILGVGLAVVGIQGFRSLGPADFPRLADVTLSLPVLGFGLALALATGLLFGVGPALRGSHGLASARPDGDSLRATSGRRTLRLRGGLITVEVALALVLLTGCGLLTRSVYRLQDTDPGIDPAGLLLMQVRLLPSSDGQEERIAFFSELRHRLESLPDVVSASHVADPPMGFSNWAPNIWREEDALSEEPSSLVRAHPVGLSYFRTMGIPIRRGRTFTEDDGAASPPVAVVSETLASSLWPGENPVGRRIGISIDHGGPWVTVVGVAGDIRQGSLASAPAGDLYLPYTQASEDRGLFMVIRTSGDPLALTGSVRAAVWSLNSNVPVPEITSMKARVDATLRLPRFRALLLAAFALAALILAGAGIYGTLVYTVGRRTPEIGIRMALGAEAGNVLALVFRQGLRPVLLGVGLGLGISSAFTRVLESFLFQVSPLDSGTFFLTAGVLLCVSGVACYLPARRATRIEPVRALRGQE